MSECFYILCLLARPEIVTETHNYLLCESDINTVTYFRDVVAIHFEMLRS